MDLSHFLILHLDLFALICSTFHWVETVIEAGHIEKLKVMIDELIKKSLNNRRLS